MSRSLRLSTHAPHRHSCRQSRRPAELDSPADTPNVHAPSSVGNRRTRCAAARRGGGSRAAAVRRPAAFGAVPVGDAGPRGRGIVSPTTKRRRASQRARSSRECDARDARRPGARTQPAARRGAAASRCGLSGRPRRSAAVAAALRATGVRGDTRCRPSPADTHRPQSSAGTPIPSARRAGADLNPVVRRRRLLGQRRLAAQPRRAEPVGEPRRVHRAGHTAALPVMRA